MIPQWYCRSIGAWILIGLVLTLTVTEAFYLPGLAPVNFCKKTDVSTTCKVCMCVVRVYYHLSYFSLPIALLDVCYFHLPQR